MPRPFCRRRIGWMPGKFRFLPEGVEPQTADFLVLTLDELEALRLADLLGLYQEEAAEKMGISRPTFARILESARKKVAEALVNGKALVIEGGPVEVYGDSVGPGRKGPRCFRGGEPMPRGSHGHHLGRQGLGPEGYCLCPKCGFRKEHQPGIPCLEERCPNCGSALIREGSEHHQLIQKKKSK